MPAREGSTARRKARKRALDVLYEADIRGVPAAEVLAARVERGDPPVAEYTVGLVEGVDSRRDRIDELITTYAEGWTLDRMPPVDRNLLRLSILELVWREDVPDAVAINEAVEMATDLSTDESPKFVNGLLGRLQLMKQEGVIH